MNNQDNLSRRRFLQLTATGLGSIYLLLMWRMALNEYEKGLFSDIFLKILGVLRGKVNV